MSELEECVSRSVFCDILVRKVREYFKVEEHRKDFEEWYRKEYGKEYEWRDAHDKQSEAGEQL